MAKKKNDTGAARQQASAELRGYPGDSFADQLIFVIQTKGSSSVRKTAELAGVHFQSLSRFIGEDRAPGEKQTGLDSGTLECLWSHFQLSIAVMDGTGELVRIASSGGFAEQLRESIRISGVRPVQLTEATNIPKSSLSLFLNGRRPGLAFRNVEKLWSYLHLRITTWTTDFAVVQSPMARN